MQRRPSFNELRAYGFHLGVPNGVAPRGWIEPGNIEMLANDAQIVTAPNATVPAELTAYYDPRVIDVITRPHKARAVFNEVKKGDWTTSHAKFRINELTGSSQPYDDFGDSRTSGVNYNWVTREQYVFQTVIEYGDFEEAVSAVAKIQLVADKQRGAAHILDTDANLFYLLGVSGRDIYGILNAPNLTPAITPLPSGIGNSVLWVDKNTQNVYGDILELFRQLVLQGDGWIDQSSAITLLCSPAAAVDLGKVTDLNTSVLDMLNKYFTALKVVTLPEMADPATGESIMLIADEMDGNPTGELAFSDKIRAGRIVADLSSFRQKWTSTTFGAIVRAPFAIATMRGIR